MDSPERRREVGATSTEGVVPALGMTGMSSNQAGAVLPLVLVVTAAMTVLVGDLVLRAQVGFDRSLRAIRLAESRSLLRSIEDRLPKVTPEQMAALAALGVQEAEADAFTLRISAASLESRLNIQRLDDLIIGESLQKLFQDLVKKERLESRAFPAAMDWIDADDEVRQGGAERLDYLGEDVSPRNAPFETVDELAFVRGFRDPSAFERIATLITVHGSGKIYVPAASDQMMELFESTFGVVVRNSLEDLRRNPDRELALPSTGISEEDRKAVTSLITTTPTAWELTVDIAADRFFSRARYVVIATEDGISQVKRLG